MTAPDLSSATASAQGSDTCCSPAPEVPEFESAAAADLALRFKALGDPNRLMLLATIAGGESAEACVCDLTGPLNLGQPTVSHHLRILVDAGFLTREKRGTWSYYSVVPGALQGLCNTLCSEAALSGLMTDPPAQARDA